MSGSSRQPGRRNGHADRVPRSSIRVLVNDTYEVHRRSGLLVKARLQPKSRPLIGSSGCRRAEQRQEVASQGVGVHLLGTRLVHEEHPPGFDGDVVMGADGLEVNL